LNRKGVEGHEYHDKTIEPNVAPPVITQEALAHLGDGRLAYVKTISSEDVANLFPQAPKIDRDSNCFPCMPPTARRSCCRTREAALANAGPRARGDERSLKRSASSYEYERRRHLIGRGAFLFRRKCP